MLQSTCIFDMAKWTLLLLSQLDQFLKLNRNSSEHFPFFLPSTSLPHPLAQTTSCLDSASPPRMSLRGVVMSIPVTPSGAGSTGMSIPATLMWFICSSGWNFNQQQLEQPCLAHQTQILFTIARAEDGPPCSCAAWPGQDSVRDDVLDWKHSPALSWIHFLLAGLPQALVDELWSSRSCSGCPYCLLWPGLGATKLLLPATPSSLPGGFHAVMSLLQHLPPMMNSSRNREKTTQKHHYT